MSDLPRTRAFWEDMTVRADQVHLGGNLHMGDAESITPTLWDYLITRFGVRSMLDVGAGEGHATQYFHRKGVTAFGIDGLEGNVRNAVFPLALHDLTTGPFTMPVDLTLCVELVEHVAEEYVEHVLDTLTNGRVVVMTHALPGQSGHHHVNCKPPEYWIDHFTTRGYRVSENNERYRALARADLPSSHFSRSGLVFVRIPTSDV